MQRQDDAATAECIELRALNDFCRSAPETTRSALGLEQVEIAGATLFVALNEPGILLNRVLAQRIRTAIEQGCECLFSETGEAVPGDPQHSFRNLVRAGFAPTHTRENFAPCGAPDESGRIQCAVV